MYTYFISFFCKFQQSYNLSLWRFQAKRNLQCNFDYKYLFIKISQKNIYKPYLEGNMFPRTLKYRVGVQQGQSYVIGRKCLFSLGWPPFLVMVSW